MAWTFDEKSPIYLQIAYRVKLKIVSKELSMGQQLLPVREFAQEAGVNPNTVQRAFQELEKEGLVYSARTSGRFVTEDEKLIDQKRHEIAQTLMKNFVTEMTAIVLAHLKSRLSSLTTSNKQERTYRPMTDIVTLTNLTKTYNGIPALRDVTMSIPSGKIVGLLGPNGSGKTTLIKILNGLLQPTSGLVTINGFHPSPITKAQVAYLPDITYLDESKTIQYYLDFFQDFYADFRYPLALQLLEDLKLQPDLRLKDLSKGNKEKVQLILVMSREAKLYLLDEPIGGVDPASRDYILKTIINQYSEDASVIISTHLIADIESVLDEVVFLKYGQIELQGDTDNIRQVHGKSIDKLFREMFHN